MYDAKDKVFLVTGGSAGIGAAVTRAFLNEGAKHAAVLDLDIPSGEALEKELTKKHGPNRIKFYKCDVTSNDLNEAFDSVIKEFGYIDVVLNIAGIMNDSPKMYEKQIAVNVTALVTSSLKAYNLMRKDHGGKGGTVINISSIAGLFQVNCLPIYAATKSAVLQFSNTLGAEPHCARSGVRVIAICFGCTDTSLLHANKFAGFDKETDDDELIMNTIKVLPMQRIESAAQGLVEAYKSGASGSTWLVTSNRPAEDITENVTKGYEIMSTGIFH